MRGESIATKQEIAQELTRIGLYDSEAAHRDKVNALLGASKMLGYDAPTRSETVIIHATVQQWIDAQRQAVLPAASAPAQIGPGDPPIEARADALSPPPNISQNSTIESKEKP